MKNIIYFPLFCICLWISSCQSGNKGTGSDNSCLQSSAACEVNTIFSSENHYYPENHDSLYFTIAAQIDSLKEHYVNIKISTVSNVEVQHDVINHLSGVDKNLFDIEDWLDEDDFNKYQQSLKLLQRYIDSEVKASSTQGKVLYPYDETKDVLANLMQSMSMLYSEAIGYTLAPSINLLYYRYLQQALAFCPDVSRMADMIASDGNAAILSVDETMYQRFSKPILLKDADGGWIPVIHEGFRPIRMYSYPYDNKIFYLFSRHGEVKIHEHFDCRLYMLENKVWQHIEIAGFDNIPEEFRTKKAVEVEPNVWSVEEWDGNITYHPKQMRWNYCYEKDGKFYPHPGSKTLYLDIDYKRAKARFRLEKEY